MTMQTMGMCEAMQQIQNSPRNIVLINDTLPLKICIDCCILLNQCSEFVERTNQAQHSLKELLIGASKLDPIQQQQQHEQQLDTELQYISKTFPKEEIKEIKELVECHLGSDYANDESNSNFYKQKNNNNKKCEDEEEEEDEDEEDSGSAKKKRQARRGGGKGRRKAKRRGEGKSGEDSYRSGGEIAAASGHRDADGSLKKDLDGAGSGDREKGRVKIPDNYMTGSESDIEIIEAHTMESQKLGRMNRVENMIRFPWLCTDCNDKLSSLEKLEEHHEVVHSQRPKYMCVLCCKVYDKYYGFLTHVKRHKNKTKFSCDDCGKSFVHKKVLDSHKAIHSEERPHVCPTCGKSFRQQSALYIHSRCHLPDTMKNRFPCDQCDKRFSTKPNLVTHKRIHSGVRNFTCDQCGKSFIQKGNLEAHFLTHSADKPYSCTQCSKAFKTPLQLKKHETVHTGAKPHQCAVCGRTFREKGTLREHHRIHTGAMPFTCEFCGKSFRFKGILTTHRRQHTGERPYSCHECQHHFTNWPNYNKHMKRRHGINTSHTKNLTAQAQQAQTQAQQQEQRAADNSATPVDGTNIHVIQSSASQPIVVHAIPTTTPTSSNSTTSRNNNNSSSSNNETVSTANQSQPNIQSEGPGSAVHAQRTAASYFNAMPAALQNFLPPNLSYNFYNISNVTYRD
ncbi:zinc finger protein 37-like [Ceratina calcarata]|uniref:Zinc finger protein 37-like n=1 Tax=Ceratina calcarata TaxID=156304 RepID=A0AAJ7S368_9HYME|nr:zinc finger protein 37-like [Ceratina calcarata]